MRDGIAAFIETGVDEVSVDKVVRVSEAEDQVGDGLHDGVEEPAVKLVGDVREQCVEPDDGVGVKPIHVEGVMEDGKCVRLNLLQRVGLLRVRDLAAVEYPAEGEADEDQRGRREHYGENAVASEGGEVENGVLIFEEVLEPWPRGRADEAEKHGTDGEDDERDGHDGGTLVGWAVMVRGGGVVVVMQEGVSGERLARGGGEDVADLARHVEGGKQRANGSHVKRRVRERPVVGGVEDFVLAPEAGEEQREAAEREHADRVGGEGKRHESAQTAHVADVLLAIAAVDDGACAEEEQCLEEGMRDEMEHAHGNAADAEAHHHVAELRDGGVGEDALDIELRDGDKRAEESGESSDPGDDLQRDGGCEYIGDLCAHERVDTRDEEDSGSNHGGRVDESADGSGAFHRVR